ncbi:MAG: hypothetical protein HQK89_08960 [Nitrospirae bacterium]|nr:hypothetical protein [Nitrospirota bacterium]
MITLTPYSFKKQFKVLEMGIKSLASDISVIKTQLSGLSVESIDRKSESFKPGEIQTIDFVPALDGQIREFLGHLEARILDRLETRILDHLETRILDRIEERFSGHVDELEAFISKTNESSFQKTEDSLRAVSGGLRSYVDESLALRLDTGTRQSPDVGMKGTAESLSAEWVSGLNVQLAGIKADLAGLKSDLAALTEKEVDASVEKLQGVFDKLAQGFDEIKTFVATNKVFSTGMDFDVQLKCLQERIDGNYDDVFSRIESALSERIEISLRSVAEEVSSFKGVLTRMNDGIVPPVGESPVSESTMGESTVNESAMSELRVLSDKLDALQKKFSDASGNTNSAIKGIAGEIAKVEHATECIFGRMDEGLKITVMKEIATLKEGLIEIIRFLMATSR